MKFFFGNIYIILFLLLGGASFAQTKDSIGEQQPKKIADPKDHIVVDFSFDSYRNLPKDINQKPYSLGGNAYLMWDYPFGYGPFSFAIGAGFSTHDVHTNGRITYSIDGKYTSFVPITTKYSTNKFSCNYMEIPIELRIRTKGEKSFKLSLGGKVGYGYNIHTKYADVDGKIKVYRIKNVNPFRYGISFRIGYNKFNFQGYYALSELFKKGSGEPNMTQFSLGVGLLLY
ncbi:MAG: outer membrane beta-barrel protein [Bacteroidetes bacterium]|nr:outer membrane beta-barrel protein [Bacteroidota bacterium]